MSRPAARTAARGRPRTGENRLPTRRSTGTAIIAAIVLVAALAPLIAPHDPIRTGVVFLGGPSAEHWLGTDDLGRDILSRILHGARTSLVIGIGAAAVATVIGVPVGLIAGYFRGRIDLLLVQVIDLFVALPGLVLALILTAMIGSTIENLVLVLGFVMWPTMARLVRGQVLQIREQAFVEAARALGGRDGWIIVEHILPNTLRVVAAQFAITVSFAIFTSASLSFLGLGVPPPTPDWGGMVREGFQFLALRPLMSLAPGGAVALTILGFYLIGSSID
jgi:peptide/nickel transport system permease protein